MPFVDKRLRLEKDPADAIAFTFNWQSTIGERTVVSSSWVATALTLVANSYQEQKTTVLVSGGTLATKGKITNIITDSSGLVYSRAAEIVIQHRVVYVEKRASEKLIYSVDWSEIPIANVSSQNWIPVTGLTYSDTRFETGIASVTIAGGTIDTVYRVQNRLLTTDGQILHKGYAMRVV